MEQSPWDNESDRNLKDFWVEKKQPKQNRSPIRESDHGRSHGYGQEKGNEANADGATSVRSSSLRLKSWQVRL